MRYDPKSNFYRKKIEGLSFTEEDNACCHEFKKIEKKNLNLPFKCFKCCYYFINSKKNMADKKCSSCTKISCEYCEIKEKPEDELKELFKDLPSDKKHQIYSDKNNILREGFIIDL